MSNAVRVLAVILAVCVPAAAQEPAAPSTNPTVITMTAKKYAFDPGRITVTRGQAVRLLITAADRDHGIEIKQFGIKMRLEKGKQTVVEFTPDKTGEFEFHCSVFCGLGHHGMKGTIVVVEPPKP